MKTAYRLHCANIEEVESIYIGVIEFQTYDAGEMVDYIKDIKQDDIDDLYTVEVCEADDNNILDTGDGKYYLPTEFVNSRN